MRTRLPSIPRLVLLALFLGALAAPGRARAQEDEARRYFEAGNAAFRLGRYLVAATAFEEAYRQSPLPETAFSAAQAYRRQYWVDSDPARLRRAQELYRAYLTAVPEGGRREHAVTHLQTIDLLLARLAPPEPGAPAAPEMAAPTQLMVVSRTPGARAAIDDGPLAPVPLIQDVAPGPHRVRMEADGWFAAREEWIAVQGRLVVIEKELAPRPASLRVRAPAGTWIAIDGARAVAAPLPGAVSLPHGPHRVVGTARGRRPFVRSLLLARGERAVVDVELRWTRQRLVAWSLLAGAGVTLASAALTSALALGAESRAADIWERYQARQEPLSGGDLVHYRDDVALRNDLRGASIALGATTLALAMGWALLYWLDAPTPDDAAH